MLYVLSNMANLILATSHKLLIELNSWSLDSEQPMRITVGHASLFMVPHAVASLSLSLVLRLSLILIGRFDKPGVACYRTAGPGQPVTLTADCTLFNGF